MAARAQRCCAKCGAEMSAERGLAAWWVNWKTYTSKWLCSMCSLAYYFQPDTGKVLARQKQRSLFDLV